MDGRRSIRLTHRSVLSRLKQFRAINKLKTLALKVIAENLSEEEIHGLKAMFANMDTDNSGTIIYDELKSGLGRLGTKLTETEVKRLMEADGRINYEEFCTMMRSGTQQQGKLF